MPKPCKGHQNQGFSIFEKIEKSMPKWLPKIINNRPKSTMGPSRFDLFIDIIDLGPFRKKHVFKIGPKRPTII